MLRIARRLSGSYTITARPVDDHGDVLNVAGRTLGAQLLDGAGTPIDGIAEPTIADELLSLQIPVAKMPLLDQYMAIITADDDSWPVHFELVGGYHCEIADIRAQADMDSEEKYPVAKLRAARSAAEDDIESCAMGAYVHRGCRETIITNDGFYGLQHDLLLESADLHSRTVYSVAVNGVPLSDDELSKLLVTSNGLINRVDGWPPRARIDIHYEHGDASVPPQIAAGCARHTRRFVLADGLGGRASMESSGEFGAVRLTFATRPGETGDMDLDAAIKRTGHIRSTIRPVS